MAGKKLTTIRNWRYPVDKVQLGSKFGVIDQFHKAPGHRGTDYNGLPEGSPLKAVCDGMTVVANKWSDVLGNVLVLQIGSRFFGYCHMHSPSPLKIGAVVNHGAIVGKLGNTGSSSAGGHLHFTLSDSIDGVFFGTVYDAHKFITDKISEEKK